MTALISLKVVKILIHNSEYWKGKVPLQSDQANAWGKALSFSGIFLKIIYSRVHKSQGYSLMNFLKVSTPV